MGIEVGIGGPVSSRPAPPKPLRTFTAASDGVSFYMPRSPNEWDYFVEIGRTLERIGVASTDFEHHLVGPHREWIMLRFATPEIATAFRVGVNLPLKISVP